jgi:hypothetical protein
MHQTRAWRWQVSAYEDEADEEFQTDRASSADAPEGTEFHDDDIGDAAYTWMNSEGVLCGPLDRDRYSLPISFIDRYGRMPETGPIR